MQINLLRFVEGLFAYQFAVGCYSAKSFQVHC